MFSWAGRYETRSICTEWVKKLLPKHRQTLSSNKKTKVVLSSKQSRLSRLAWLKMKETLAQVNERFWSISFEPSDVNVVVVSIVVAFVAFVVVVVVVTFLPQPPLPIIGLRSHPTLFFSLASSWLTRCSSCWPFSRMSKFCQIIKI